MTKAVDALAAHYFQTAWVVRDLAAAEEWFGRVMGVPAWTRFDVVLGEESRYRGRPADSAMAISLGYAGEVQIELIESVRGPNIYTEFLDAKGPGLHHIAFAVPDFDATVAQLREERLPELSSGILNGGSVKFAYFDCAAAGASVIEILGFDAATTDAMAQMKAAAYAARQTAPAGGVAQAGVAAVA